MTLRPRPFGQLAGIGAIGRERQRHRGRQLHDGVGGLGGADAEAADHDGDHRHFGGLGAVGVGGIDRERLQAVGDHRDHAVARFFQQALIDPGHHRRGRCVRPRPCRQQRRRRSATSWRLPLEPSMMVTVFCSPAACLGAAFMARFGMTRTAAAAGLFFRFGVALRSACARSARRRADCR